ncbi:MAG TPA: hypothetical protein VFT56_17035 [Sphingomonas sp.]|nr:hypothetical protein [Sphingomonas sp.]
MRLYKQGSSTVATDPDLMGLVNAHNDGFKVILNLKYNFTGSDFPSDPNSQAFLDLRAFTTQLLDQVFPSVDIIVVGNEPFIESDPADRDNDLVLFYKHMANHVITYNRSSGRNIPLYVGAFNNLQKPDWETQPAKDLIAYARNTPGVTGIDLHLHTASVAEMQQAIDWAKGQLGSGKAIISTEFSIKNYFKNQLGKTIDPTFAAQYDVDPSWKVYQYLNYSLQNPRPRPEWVDFLKGSDWFMSHHLALENADTLFDSEGLVIATYSLRQSQSSIGPTTDPWMLNALYCNRSCVPNPTTGLPQFNYQWIDSFRLRE